MYHTGFGSVHKLANRVAKKAKLNLGQQRRVQANRERRLQKEHTTVVDDTLFGPAIEDSATGKDVWLAAAMRCGLYLVVAGYGWLCILLLEQWWPAGHWQKPS